MTRGAGDAVNAGAGAQAPAPAPAGARGIWIVIVTMAAIAAAVQLFVVQPLAPSQAPFRIPLVVLALGFAAAEVFVVYLQLGREAHSLSLSEVPLVVGLCFADPTTLVLGRLVGAVGALLWHRRAPFHKLAFNIAHFWLEAGVALLIWRAILGGGNPLHPRGWMAVLATAGLVDLLGAGLITLAIRTRDPRSQLRLTRKALWAGAVSAFVNACFALVVVTVLWVDWRGAWMLLVVTALLFLAHRAHASLRERHDSLERLNRFARFVGVELQVESVARAVLFQLRQQLRAEWAEITLYAGFASAEVRLACGPDGTITTSGTIGEGLAGTLCPQASAEPLLAPRHTKDPQVRRRLSSCGLRDAMAVPLLGDAGVIGAIVVGDRLGDVATFADEDLRVLEALANHASIALHNGRLADRLRQQVRENEHQALHDSLTGLGNRTLFHQDVLERTREGTRIAILLLDLDRFKEVNDALGHHTGDRLLEEVGMRLRQSLPEAASVARLGGDEFAVLLSGQAAEEAVLIGQRVRDELLRPFVLRGVSLTADASVGIALSPQHGCDGETLLQHADVAMYAAKSARSGVEVYSPGQDQHSPERLALIAELREALETGTLTVHYQPQADLDTSRIYGVEALVRWKHPERGFVPPDEIILVAERTGLIHQLTRYVLATALEQCRAWRDARTAIGVAVNLSPSSLLDVGFAQELEHLLEATGVPPAALTLEITENSIMADPDRTITVLAGLRALGIHLAVDDLGTGYASLSYLKRLPVDEIKIDKSFVMAMSSDPDDDAIVSAIVGLARRLGKRVVAEGVEDELTWLRLQRLGCDGAQGYWLSRPLEGRQVLPWLEAWSLTGPAAQLAGIGCPA